MIYGLYIVGYYDCSICEKSGCPNKASFSQKGLAGVRELFSHQAGTLSDNAHKIISIVIDNARRTRT